MILLAAPILIVGWLTVAAGTALAAPDPREARARAACNAGDVEKGVALLAQIANETGDVNAFYNQARCYQKNGRNDEALERFKEYRRRAPNLSADEAAQVEGFIRDLESEQQARQAARAEPTTVPRPPADAERKLAAPATASEGTHPSLVAPAVLAGVGVAALAAGVYFGLKVRSIQNELESPNPISAADYHDKNQSGQQAETYQWVSYGIAVAAAAGSALTYLLGRAPSASAEAPRVGFAPTLGRDAGAGGVARFTF
jgi:tetratricopeptide (TPR) repeat protein